MDQLFDIKLRRIDCTEIRTYGLTLNGQLNFPVGNFLSQRGIEFMCFPSTTSRWPPAAIKKYHIYAEFLRYAS